MALPAWGMSIDEYSEPGRDFLDFGATVWDAGPAPMVVEGFRRTGTNIMDAWQTFYRGDKPVARAPVGTLVYDSDPGHEHWHFKQFAAYRLLGADKQQVVRSQKTGFCLAPTDAIDEDKAAARTPEPVDTVDIEPVLAGLPDNYRRVLELRFLRGYTIKETAGALGVSVNNAKVLQLRALRRAASNGEGLV